MSAHRMFALLLLSTSSTAALAADELKFGPAPSWVVASKVPDISNAPEDAPIAMLLMDQQIHLDRDKTSIYSEAAIKIQNGQGLAIGNVSFPWDPSTSTVTVHKLLIHRGKEVIDVLAGGQKFQVIRREGNLELAMFDGRLTASIQPEGLQVGDILDFATTVEVADPILKGHVETTFAAWNELPFKSAKARVTWPTQMDLKFRKSENLPALNIRTQAGRKVAEISLQDAEPLIPPKGAPLRFSLGRIAEASDYKSWSQVADLLIPYYDRASVIPPSGPLRDEVERIRKASADPSKRAELALDLVQDRIRYVALLMGEGGYIPASAESTWSRRFGDCKAKTALLLAILHEFDIEAAPAAVNSRAGDALTGRLPMLGLFDHVLVRAKIKGKTYWLDGTRTGDTTLGNIETPDFRWALPLVANADLISLTPDPLSNPSMETVVSIDASAGVYSASPFKADRLLRGDVARALQPAFANMTKTQLDQSMRDYWRNIYDYVTISSATYSYDKDRGELKLSMSGDAKIEWKDGWYYVPHSGLAYEPDLDRAPGPDQAAPWNLSFPSYDRAVVTIKLPSGFAAAQSKLAAPVKETLAGVEYFRTVDIKDNVLVLEKSERAIVPEITHATALAAKGRLKALSDEDVYLRVPDRYRVTNKDIETQSQEKPSSADAFVSRGLIYLDKSKFDEAIADLSEANKLDPKDPWALANRGVAYVWKRNFKAAETDLTAAEALDPDNKVVRRGRGLMAELKGNLSEALTLYDKILTRSPDDNFVRLRRSAIRVQQGKRDEALVDIDAVIASDPGNPSALAQRAYISALKEDWPRAEKDVAVALSADPENAMVLATKAMIAMQRRDYKSALDLASEALKRDPDSYYARYLQAQLLKRQNGGKGALQSFDEAVARTPTDITALLARASVHLEQKDFDAAQKDIDAVLKIAPSDTRATIAQGYLASAKGDHESAIKAYSAALNASPSNASVFASRAESYRQLGKYDLAFADTDAALAGGLISPGLRLQRLNILLQLGDLKRANLEADKLVSENPNSEFALVAAGKGYAAIGERQKGLAAMDRAIAVNPVPFIYINRSQIRPPADLAERLADLDAALKIDGNYEDALAEKARLLSKAGRHSEAVALYDQAIKLALDSEYLELGRAIALERAGRLEEAKKAFEVERSRAKTAGDFNRLCWTKAINDVELQAALEDCNTALRLDPENRGATDSRGLALLKLGKAKEALLAYDKAVAIKMGANSYMGRAIARARLGDANGAQSDLQEARKLRPNIDETFEEYGFKPTAELARELADEHAAHNN